MMASLSEELQGLSLNAQKTFMLVSCLILAFGIRNSYVFNLQETIKVMLTHISNDYFFSTVYSNLTSCFAEKGVRHQFVYSPLKSNTKNIPQTESNVSIKIAAPRMFNQLIRYLPLTKILLSFVGFIFSLRKHRVRPSFIIAHNLWSDGMVAWLYYKFTGTPYTVGIRNTDINLFIPKLKHYHWLMRRVVSESQCTVFINRAYVERVKRLSPSISNSMSDFKVIYNGIDEEWFSLADRYGECLSEKKAQVIYVGSFIPNKNLKNSVSALMKINKKGKNVSFLAIGGTEVEFLQCTGLSKMPDWVAVVPRTQDRDLIARYLRESRVFLMPSFHETFGLVYIEALSQGCCLIHSENEGIDGLFNEQFVQSVDPHCVDDISDKVDSLISQFPCGVSPSKVRDLIADFAWPKIVEQYLKIINGGRTL